LSLFVRDLWRQRQSIFIHEGLLYRRIEFFDENMPPPH
jgi:hypothetical protein